MNEKRRIAVVIYNGLFGMKQHYNRDFFHVFLQVSSFIILFVRNNFRYKNLIKSIFSLQISIIILFVCSH